MTHEHSAEHHVGERPHRGEEPVHRAAGGDLLLDEFVLVGSAGLPPNVRWKVSGTPASATPRRAGRSTGRGTGGAGLPGMYAARAPLARQRSSSAMQSPCRRRPAASAGHEAIGPDWNSSRIQSLYERRQANPSSRSGCGQSDLRLHRARPRARVRLPAFVQRLDPRRVPIRESRSLDRPAHAAGRRRHGDVHRRARSLPRQGRARRVHPRQSRPARITIATTTRCTHARAEPACR